MALQTAWEADYGLPQDPFAGAILFSGIYDIEPLRYSYLQPQIQLDDRTIRHQSPAFTARPCKTPIWVTWGGAETTEFARQSTLFDAAWKAQGNTAELRAIPDADHFTVIAGLETPHSDVCQWLARTLQAKTNV
jgi:arylformamidase